ncbi:MAG: hypothetical protein QOJ65_296 [Fimbriimonadaceae bacterium]|jgi:hypothetical protein|nr:hypothetical protein [Fimbriimonadaceae bacterium]
MAIQGYNPSSYMIRPTEWSDTIIRPHTIASKEARMRVHAGLFSFAQRSPSNALAAAFRPFTIYHLPFTAPEARP